MEGNVIKKSRVHSPDASTSQEGLVEKLPVEIIGEILSRVGAVRDVIRASLTHRKWREAYRKHLHTLSFDVSGDDPVYSKIRTADLEVLITKTLFQMTGVRKLSIVTYGHKVSAVAALGWLMFTRETLSELFYRVITSPTINVLDICGRRKLKTLSLYENTITGVELGFHRFPCLTSLCLIRCRTSEEDLNRLLLALPKLECLELHDPQFRFAGEVYCSERVPVKLHLPTLKTLLLINLIVLDLILEPCDVGYLHLKRCAFDLFKITGTKNVRQIKISKSEFQLLEIEEGDNLETLEIVSSHVFRSNLFPMKVRAPKLKMLRIWRLLDRDFPFFYSGDESEFVLDLDRMAVCSPQLSHLSIFYHGDEWVDYVNYNLRGLSPLENVVILDVGWERFKDDCVLDFTEWTEKVLKCCPNLRKLIVHGEVKQREDCPEYLKDLAEHASSMSEMLSKYPHLEVKFTYDVETFQNTPLHYGFGADW